MTKRVLLCCFLVLGSLPIFVPGAEAFSSNGSHCPQPSSGYVVWDTSTEPYHADNAVDTNNDGIVCAKPVDSQTFELNGQTYQIYNFIDNTIR